MRSGFLAVTACGAVALVLVLVLHTNDRAFTLGVAPLVPVAEIGPRQHVCQSPIEVPAEGAFDRARVYVGTYGRPSGPPLTVTVQSVPYGRVLGRGTVAQGYPDIATAPPLVASLPRIAAGQRVAVCVRNDGNRRVALFGASGEASPSSSAKIGSRDALPADITIEFLRSRSRTLLELVPAMLDRASLFRFPWLAAWRYWVLLVGVVLVAPAALFWGLRGLKAERPHDGAGGDSDAPALPAASEPPPDGTARRLAAGTDGG